MSRPTRGEWIEIRRKTLSYDSTSVSPYLGEWIEISFRLESHTRSVRLTLHGASGLKSRGADRGAAGDGSRPAWGEWIEMRGRHRADLSV